MKKLLTVLFLLAVVVPVMGQVPPQVTILANEGCALTPPELVVNDRLPNVVEVQRFTRCEVTLVLRGVSWGQVEQDAFTAATNGYGEWYCDAADCHNSLTDRCRKEQAIDFGVPSGAGCQPWEVEFYGEGSFNRGCYCFCQRSGSASGQGMSRHCWYMPGAPK